MAGGQKANSTVVQKTEPWAEAKPYFQDMFGAAKDAYAAGADTRQGFQGPIYAAPNQTQRTALDWKTQQASSLATGAGALRQAGGNLASGGSLAGITNADLNQERDGQFWWTAPEGLTNLAQGGGRLNEALPGISSQFAPRMTSTDSLARTAAGDSGWIGNTSLAGMQNYDPSWMPQSNAGGTDWIQNSMAQGDTSWINALGGDTSWIQSQMRNPDTSWMNRSLAGADSSWIGQNGYQGDTDWIQSQFDTPDSSWVNSPLMEKSLRGDFLYGASNPYLKSAVENAQRQARDQFDRTILPELKQTAAGEGAYGGSREALIRGQAYGDLGKSFGDLATQAYVGNYEAERQRQTAFQQMQLQGLDSERSRAAQMDATLLGLTGDERARELAASGQRLGALGQERGQARGQQLGIGQIESAERGQARDTDAILLGLTGDERSRALQGGMHAMDLVSGERDRMLEARNTLLGLTGDERSRELQDVLSRRDTLASERARNLEAAQGIFAGYGEERGRGLEANRTLLAADQAEGQRQLGVSDQMVRALGGIDQTALGGYGQLGENTGTERGFASSAEKTFWDNWNQERNRAMNAGSLFGQANALEGAASDTLGRVGDQQQMWDQDAVDAEMRRWQMNAAAPWTGVGEFAAALQGAGFPSTTQQNMVPRSSSIFQGATSGGILGMNLANQFGGNPSQMALLMSALGGASGW